MTHIVASTRAGCLAGALLGVLLLPAPAALAAQQTLHFKLVTHQLNDTSDMPEIAGHKVYAGRYMGVGMLEDGRIVYKHFVDIDDDTKDGGTYKGYSTYTFDNGTDSLTLSYTGNWDSQGAIGKYELISGTGQYAGATGGGTFKALDDPWDEAYLWDVTLNLDVATQ